MTQPESTTSGDPEETLADEEARLRALLMERLKESKKQHKLVKPGESLRGVSAPGISKPKVSTPEERRAKREERFKAELDLERQQRAAREATQRNYFNGFNPVRGSVRLTGHWNSHYNDDNPSNTTFMTCVDESGSSLADFIRHVLQNANGECMSFGPGNPNYPGQLSVVTVKLEEFYNDNRMKGMTIAGGVTATGVDVFHAGPGGL